jgi:N-acetylglucosaminyldiphosphoundecaprenol N-acetyl-beta-D-mannosaminyltransferase
VLGVEVSAIDMPIALATIDAWIAARERRYVCVTGVHGIMEEPERRGAAAQSTTTRASSRRRDAARVAGMVAGATRHGRVYGPDLMLACCAHSQARGVSATSSTAAATASRHC